MATYSVVVSDATPGSATSAGATLTVRLPVAGDLDFSVGGSLANGSVLAVALQGDGKVLIGGSFTKINNAARSGIARLNGDGSPDYSFGNGLAGPDNTVFAVAVQSDRNVLIGGAFTQVNGVARRGVARLNGDGTLDTSFASSVFGSDFLVRVVALQSDGKVLVGGGFTTINGPARRSIVRLNSDGTLDTSFGNGQAGVAGIVRAVLVQSDGKIVIGGYFDTVNGTARGGIARLNSDGTLDTSFGNGQAGAESADIYAVALQSDGKLVIGGHFDLVNDMFRHNIARLNSDGTLDPNFGSGLDGTNGDVNAVVVQSDGRVLIGGGFFTVNSTRAYYTARLNVDGTLDTTYGDSGQVGVDKSVSSMVMQGDGKVIIGGQFTAVQQGGRSRIARLNTDGTLDTSFAANQAGTDDAVGAMVMQNDGKVLLGGGFRRVNGGAHVVTARLKGDGTLDASFFDGVPESTTLFFAMALQSDGKVLVSGDYFRASDYTIRYRIARLNSDGTLDTSFGPTSFDPAGAGADDVYAIVAQSDGKVIVGGRFPGSNGVVVRSVARLNSDGTLDTSFPPVVIGPGTKFVSTLALQSDGKLLVGGQFSTINGTARGGIARLNSDGTLDTSFGEGLAGADNNVSEVVVLNDGRLLIGGDFTKVNGVARGRVARLNGDGTLDTNFGSGLAGADNTISTMALQSDGKLLIGGRFTKVNGVTRGRIARLFSDGTLDTSFGEGLAGVDNTVAAMVVQSDGNVLIGGGFTTVNGVPRDGYARLIVPPPDITIEQPAGMPLSDGTSAVNYGLVQVGQTSEKVFTIHNPGAVDLTVLSVTVDGAGAGDFSVGTLGSPVVTVGGSTTFTVTFNPVAGGGHNAVLHVMSNTPGTKQSYDIALNGTGNEAPVAPNGSVFAVQGVPRTIALLATDADGDPLTVIGTTPDPNLTVNTTSGLNVTFTPAANFVGEATFGYTVSDGRGGSASGTITVQVWAPPDITIEQPAGMPLSDGTSTVNYGLVQVGQPSQKIFTIKNPGGADLAELAAVVDGAGAGDFLVSAPSGTTVAMGGSATFTVTFGPVAGGVHNAVLHVTSNAPGSKQSYDIALTGTGNEAPVAPNGNVFAVQGVSKTITLLATDADGDPLTVTGTTPDSNLTVNTASGLSVTFTPAANFIGEAAFGYTVSDGRGGSASGTIMVNVGSRFDIAVEQPRGTTLSDGTSTVNYGLVQVGQPSEKIFTIKNSGVADLTVLAVTMDGVGAGDFRVSVPGNLTVAVGGSATFTVAFDPAAGGVRNAALHVTSNAPGTKQSYDIALTGTGNEAPVAANRDVFAVQGVAKTIALPSTDADNDPLTVTGTTPDSNLTVNTTSGLNVTFTPVANFVGEATFGYTVSDGRGGSASGTITVNVRPPTAGHTVVLVTRSPAPGHGTNELPDDAVIASFNTPAIDNAGNLAFVAKWTGAGLPRRGGSGLFTTTKCLAVVGGDASAVVPGAKWRSFSDPVVDAGRVACLAKLSGMPASSAQVVVVFAADGTPEIVARAGGDAPEEVPVAVAAKFRNFKAVALAGDAVGFLAQRTVGTGDPRVTAATDMGVWVKKAGAPLTIGLREGFSVSGQTMRTLSAFLAGNGSAGAGRGWLTNSLASGPEVVVLGTNQGGSRTVDVAGTDDHSVTQAGATKAGGTGITGLDFRSFGVPARNSDGSIALLGHLGLIPGVVTAANADGIFLSTAGASAPRENGGLAPGTFAPIARTDGPALPGAKFSAFKDPVLASDGGLVFPATIKGALVRGVATQTLWWKPPGQNLRLLAQGGGAAAELPGSKWKAFTSLAIAAVRGPIFAASITPGKGAAGVWATDFTGTTRLLFCTGAPLAVGGKTVKSFKVLNATVGSTGVTRSFNDAAQVVWLATFVEDKSQAIVVTEVP
jgi:uncharacterized delta-60 repeat protein